MNTKAVFFIFLSVLAGLNLGTVRKAEDPIRDTQTNPILYEQKKEEEKDGKKGPLLYNVKNNPRETFFIDPPFESAEKGSPSETAIKEIPQAEAEDWWEEQPAPPPLEPVTPADTGSEFLVQPASEEKNLQESKAEPPEVPPDAEAGKGDDYWW